MHWHIFSNVKPWYDFPMKTNRSSPMSQIATTPDKYDIFIQKIDHFQSMVEEKKALQEKIARMYDEFKATVSPLEQELASIMRNLEMNLSKLEKGTSGAAKSTGTRFSRGQLGNAIKGLLRAHPQKAFKPREIADALNTKGTTISVWFNKFGAEDQEIERIPTGKEGKRFLYKIK
ncbi:hypothetical protein EKD02_03045 [Chlorobium phaeovibrioides]|uniref:Uncharacterized protein n=2 Tax=Chlorobium phaeovibrioides TaxID=1094 RepID=A0A3S0NJP3_CHLPH|nr:hypothetical protein FNV82_01690 [Chlorobium phaeovibrioides]RTY39087.1 hypothetical protein EKD02_03045 [Chlorobium phaeovibrioides]